MNNGFLFWPNNRKTYSVSKNCTEQEKFKPSPDVGAIGQGFADNQLLTAVLYKEG
jgi:hypothetical protein